MRIGAVIAIALAGCSLTRVDTRVQLTEPAMTQIWTRDERREIAPRLEPGDTPVDAYARRYRNWPWKDDVLLVRREASGAVVTVCEKPDCDGRPEITVIDPDGWTMDVSDPATEGSVPGPGWVDLQFVGTPGRHTSLYGWIRTPDANIARIMRTTGPTFPFGSQRSVVLMALGAVILATSATVLANHSVTSTGARVALAAPGLVIGTLDEVFAFSGLFISTRSATETR